VCSNRSTNDVRNPQTKNKDMAAVSVRAHAHALGSRAGMCWCMGRVWRVEAVVRAQTIFSRFFFVPTLT
jgi:hypothetical protein